MRSFIIMLLIFVDLSCFAGPHTMQRGESFEDVAMLYNIPLDSLLKYNDEVTPYTGYTIDVPVNILFYDLGDNDFFRRIRYMSNSEKAKGMSKYRSAHDKHLKLTKKNFNKKRKDEIDKILEEYSQSAQLGCVEAMYQLGYSKVHGYIGDGHSSPSFMMDMNPDFNEFCNGLALLQMAALLGNHQNSLIGLAIACGHESSPIRNSYLCLSMLEMYKEDLNLPVDRFISYIYENGYGVRQDLLKAYVYCPNKEIVEMNSGKSSREKLLDKIDLLKDGLESAKYGNGISADIMFSKGLSFYHDDILEPEGLYWLHRAARQNHPDANWMLAGVLKNKHFKAGSVGSNSDDQAMCFVKKAAQCGHKDAEKYLAEYREYEKRKNERERQIAVEKYRSDQEQKQKRAQMWANIVGSVFQAAAQTWMVMETSKMQARQNASNASSSYSVGNMSEAQWQARNQLAMDQILNYTIQKNIADWNGTPMMPVDMSAVNLGSVMSPGSPLWCWNMQQQINAISTRQAKASCEVQAYYKRQREMIEQQMLENPFQSLPGYVDYDGNWISYDMVAAENVYSKESSTSSGHEAIRIKNSEHYDRYGDKECHICHGTGICQTCGGSKVHNTPYGSGECPNCLLVNMRRSGKCNICGGKGTIYKLK